MTRDWDSDMTTQPEQFVAPTQSIAGLSPRELDVLRRVTNGYSNAEIAGDLFLGINTVKTYIRTAYRKTGVDRRPQASMWCIAHGLLDEQSVKRQTAQRLIPPTHGEPTYGLPARSGSLVPDETWSLAHREPLGVACRTLGGGNAADARDRPRPRPRPRSLGRIKIYGFCAVRAVVAGWAPRRTGRRGRGRLLWLGRGRHQPGGAVPRPRRLACRSKSRC